MKPLICLLALVACCLGQYTSDVQDYNQNFVNPGCTAGFDCVHKSICVNGVIDIYGTGALQQRIKKTTCGGDETCCGIPGYVAPPGKPPVEPITPIVDPVGPTGKTPCHSTQDCVASEICSSDGIIDISGGQLLDKRSKIPPSTCVNHLFPHINSVCCLKPFTCPVKQNCVPKGQCSIHGQNIGKGIPCIDDVKGIKEGVCCTGLDIIDNVFKAAGTCGIRNEKIVQEDYIPTGYGKEDAAFGEFPWMAIIFRQPPKDNPDQLLFQCGGVLITERHVLTAAHCVAGLGAHDLGVRLGEWEVNSVKEPLPYEDYAVSQLAVHSEYKHTIYNMALIELAKPVIFKYHINTICLAKDKQFSGYCVATGWGKDHFDGNYQHILKKLEVPYVDHGTCESLLQQTELSRYFRLHSSISCAGGEVARDTCTGDGGGPLVCEDPGTGQYYLAGLVNAGLQCGRENVPGLYVNVPFLDHWIQETITHFGGHADVGGPVYGR